MKKVLIEADLFLHLASPRRKTEREWVCQPHTETPKLRAQGLRLCELSGVFLFLFCFPSRVGWLGSQWGCGGTDVGRAMEDSSLDSGGDPKSSRLRL